VGIRESVKVGGKFDVSRSANWRTFESRGQETFHRPMTRGHGNVKKTR